MNPKTSQNQCMNFHIPNRSGRWQSVAEIFPGRDLRGWARGAEAKPLRCTHSHSKSGRKQNTRDGECWCWNALKIFVSAYILWLDMTYDYNLHICTVYIFTMACWSVFLDKVKGQTGFGFRGSNSICHLLRKVACMSTLVRNMVDDSGTDEEIPLPNASSSIVGNQKCLGFVMVYL